MCPFLKNIASQKGLRGRVVDLGGVLSSTL